MGSVSVEAGELGFPSATPQSLVGNQRFQILCQQRSAASNTEGSFFYRSYKLFIFHLGYFVPHGSTEPSSAYLRFSFFSLSSCQAPYYCFNPKHTHTPLQGTINYHTARLP